MKNLLKTIYYLVLGILIIIILFLIISVLPITGNIKILSVLSGSMEPTIHTGSVVVVKPDKDYKIGDIVTFGEISKTKVPITHRIQDIKVQGGQEVYTTKGDANESSDTTVITEKDITGKVLFSVPLFGYLVSFVRKPIGFLILIIVPALVIIIDEVRKIIREVQKKKPKENNEETSN